MATEPLIAGDDLQRLRAEIDALDRRLLELLSARQQRVKALQSRKLVQGKPARSPHRELALRRLAAWQAARQGLDPALVMRLYDVLFEWVEQQPVRSPAEQFSTVSRQ